MDRFTNCPGCDREHTCRRAGGCQEPIFNERDVSKPAEQQGLFRKFDVFRVDHSDQPGGKHYGCRYYVLDLTHDQHAPTAMRAYAAVCRATHPQLADDIEAEFGAAPVAAQQQYVCERCNGLAAGVGADGVEVDCRNCGGSGYEPNPAPQQAPVQARELPKPFGTIYSGNYWTAGTNPANGTPIAEVYTAGQVREILAAQASPAVPEGWKIGVQELDDEIILRIDTPAGKRAAFTASSDTFKAGVLRDLATAIAAAAPAPPQEETR